MKFTYKVTVEVPDEPVYDALGVSGTSSPKEVALLIMDDKLGSEGSYGFEYAVSYVSDELAEGEVAVILSRADAQTALEAADEELQRTEHPGRSAACNRIISSVDAALGDVD